MGKRIFILLGVAVFIFVGGLLLIGGVAAALYYYKIDLLDNPIVGALMGKASSEAAPASNATLTDNGDYRTENNWLASAITQEIAGMAWLAAHPNGPVPTFQIKATVDPQKALVHVEIKGWTSDRTITADLTPAYAWDPQGYALLAHQLMGDQKVAEPSGADASDLLNDLLTPTGKVLATKDVELSRQLLQNPASAAVHDKAALLLLALAWREHAGLYSDNRRLLCRATAHLALAHALRGDSPPGWPGKIADATLRTLSGREVDALQQLDLISQQTDSTDAAKMWIRILKLANKQDWRMETPDHNSPLLLKLVWFNMLSESQWDSLACAKLDTLAPLEDIPDWGRLLFAVNDTPRVAVGHRFCQSTIALEFRELTDVLTAENEPLDKTATPARIFTAPIRPTVFLNANGENSVSIIGTPVFKEVALRHLFSAIRQTHGWLAESYGVPDEDAKFVTQMEHLFRGVPNERRLTMMLQVKDFATRPESAGLQEDLADIPPALAIWTMWREQNCERLLAYFAWGIPFEAPYNMEVRASVLTAVQPGSAHVAKTNSPPPSVSDLMPLAPNSYEIASWIIVDKGVHGQHMTKNQRQALLAPFFDYNLYALHYFKQLGEDQHDLDDPTLEKILRQECVLAPDEYFELGELLRKGGKADEAAQVDRAGVKLALDRVLASNSIQPLVEYDYAHGNQDEALQLAQQASAVFSWKGIETYIWLLGKLNRFDEGEQWAQKEQDRYGGNALASFYIRYRDHYPDKYKNELQSAFPDGLHQVTLASFTEPPKGGCLFKTSSEMLENSGLRANDIVVALDSYLVSSEAAYNFIRSMSDSPAMDLIICRNGKYLEIKPSVPGRRFGVDTQNYHSP
jgi:hypothetical protein